MKVRPTLKDLRTTAMKTVVLTYGALMVVWWIRGDGYEPVMLAEWLPFVWMVTTAITIMCSICLRRSDKKMALLGILVVTIT
ncbi:MAG: hypothetical protein U1F77_15500, partial [Kiritimatiellia bacterium]